MGKSKDIREAVEAELTFDPLIDPSNITVKNMNGDVALNGTVPSYPQYVEAAAAAQRVAGVTNVHNHLAVDFPTCRNSPARGDQSLRRWLAVPRTCHTPGHAATVQLGGFTRTEIVFRRPLRSSSG